jgi:hypothetical protein
MAKQEKRVRCDVLFLVVAVGVLNMAIWPSPAHARIWTDPTGTWQIEAELLEYDGNSVVLKKTDGSQTKVPIEKLCKADRAFLNAGKPPQAVQPPIRPKPLPQPIPEPAGEVAAGQREDAARAALVEKIVQSVVRIKTDRALGSGFVVNANGLVVTNYHVVEDASTASVRFRDGKTLNVDGYKKFHPGHDLILLKVSPEADLPALTLSSDLPRTLDTVIACGAPEGFGWTTTRGVVSAIRKGREMRDILKEMKQIDFWLDLDMTLIQTDAAGSQGSSGGPLVDLRGDVVGVTTLGSHQNLNFAIAARHVRELLLSANGATTQKLATLPKPPPRIENVKGDQQIVLPSGKILSFDSFKLNPEAIFDWCLSSTITRT